MSNDVAMPTNVPKLNTEYIDGVIVSWFRVVMIVFSLPCKVQQLHVQEIILLTSSLWSGI